MNKKLIILYIIIALVLLFVLTKVLKRFGILKSDEKILQEKQANEIRTLDYFNPSYYLGKSFKQLSTNEAEKFARDLKKGVRSFGTNEEEIYSTFKKLPNRISISQVAEAYYRIYNEDLQSRLLNEMRDKEKAILFNIIKALPERT